MKNKKQFTLIELIIVIVVIGILAAMAMPKFNGVVRDAKLSAMINDKEVLEKTLIMYYQKNDELPLLNEDQKLIVNNTNIGLTKIVLAEEAQNSDMDTIYTSLKETLSYYKDSEETLYRIDLPKIKDNLSKDIKYGHKKTEKDFYVYSTKTGNVYYYDYLVNSNGTIQHDEYDTLINDTLLISKLKSPLLDNDKNENNTSVLLENSNIFLGEYHTMKIGKDENLYAWGRNDLGQLGIGNMDNQIMPQKVILPNGITPISVAIGEFHSVILGSDHNIYTCGQNSVGQLGIGNKTNQSTLQKVSLPNGIKAKSISSGLNFSMAIGEDDNLYSWGINSVGQLGNGNTNNQYSPIKVNLPNGIKAKSICLGGSQAIMLGSDNNLYGWGENSSGQLGIGNNINQMTPIKITLPNDVKAVSISTGLHHSMAIAEDGKLYAWGYNYSGQLGLGDKESRTTPQIVNLPNKINVKYIYLGNYNSIAIGSDGNVYSWGYNKFGQLGTGDTIDLLTPKRINSLNEIKLKSISIGKSNVMVVGNDDSIYAWGYNSLGQLGTGNTINQLTPTKIELP